MHDDVFHSCAPDMVNSSEQDPMFHHLWVVGSVCRFPMPLLKQCHAAMGMDIRERLARNSPEAIVRAYSYQGVVVPLLLCPMFFVFFWREKTLSLVSGMSESGGGHDSGVPTGADGHTFYGMETTNNSLFSFRSF